ncbi:hypothetical protein HXX76_013853 [Chlamydomonas incerta]|uniref:Uncharacterized protein n=1 Tax=Chlamydomonas incerta TaxID=51695 RepID=A0A835SSV0_CHLIN|nr:hypothetical protein HXX76_013853 [Chlamydomonas incerta]|eukprot:KAG2425271.1 hypothetical protein HXX76_013853 [Chlamydomonas incerta]
MATEWDLRAFIFGLDDLDDAEKEQCFSILDGHGAPKKRKAFLALDLSELQTAGISQLSTRKVLRLAMAGAAAGGTEEGAPGAGLSVYTRLQLRQDAQNPDLFFFEPLRGDTSSLAAAAAAGPDVSHGFFLDPGGRLGAELQEWLHLAWRSHREGRPGIVPLFINGQVKTGKSFMLNEVLPAVANTYCHSRSQSGSGGRPHAHAGTALRQQLLPNFLHVDCLSFDRSAGAGGFLLELLLGLKRAAAPQQQLAAAASTPVPAPGCSSAGFMISAIQDFMWRLPRDRLNLLLLDEAQSFYLLEQPGAGSRGSGAGTQAAPSTLDLDAVRHMRRLLKELLLDSPSWVAWAVTGSSMATLWANIAATPTNGFALLSHHRRLNLSPKSPKDVLLVTWTQLQAQAAAAGTDPPLPADLVWRSPPQVAALVYLAREWSSSRGTASTADELVDQALVTKLIPEVLEDLRAVLQVLDEPAAQLLPVLHNLLDPLAGVDAATLPLPFKVLLASFATERDGRLHLDNPLLAQVLQAVTTDSGELVKSVKSARWISSVLFRELVVLGECCKDAQHFDSDEYAGLRLLLADMAVALEPLTPEELLLAGWFTQILNHRCNLHGAQSNFQRHNEAPAQQDAKVGVRWYHALLRNVLSHGALEEQRQALGAYPPPLAAFHSSGRISEVLTATYGVPLPGNSPATPPGSRRGRAAAPSAAATPPRAQLQPLQPRPAAPVRPGPLRHLLGRQRLLGRAAAAAAVQHQYIGCGDVEEDCEGLATLVAHTAGAFSGHVFEALMHHLLPKGGEFTVMPIYATPDHGDEEPLNLPSCGSKQIVKDAADILVDDLKEGVYYRPVQSNFPTVDSLLRVGDIVHLFQMTVSSRRKTVSVKALTELYGQLGLVGRQLDLRFYYVVPDTSQKDLKMRAPAQSEGTRFYFLKGGMKSRQQPQQAQPLQQQQQLQQALQ